MAVLRSDVFCGVDNNFLPIHWLKHGLVPITAIEEYLDFTIINKLKMSVDGTVNWIIRILGVEFYKIIFIIFIRSLLSSLEFYTEFFWVSENFGISYFAIPYNSQFTSHGERSDGIKISHVYYEERQVEELWKREGQNERGSIFLVFIKNICVLMCFSIIRSLGCLNVK